MNFKASWNSIEKAFTVGALIHFGEGFIPLILSGGRSEGEPDAFNTSHPLNAAIFLLIYFIGAALVLLRWRKAAYGLSYNKLIPAFIAIVLPSFVWSQYPTNTLVESIRIAAGALFGLYFATRYTLKEQLILLRRVYLIFAFSSIAFAILPPRYGIMGGVHAGAFRGIFVHKNHFGLVMAIGSILFLMKALSEHHNRWRNWSIYGLILVEIVLSKSTASLGISLILAGLFLFYELNRRLRLSYLVLVPTVLSGVLLLWGVSFLALNNLETIANSAGKDLTLTGRTVFWAVLIRMIMKQPLLGYGIKGFWYGLQGPSREVVQSSMWDVPEAHNGFIELALSLGLVGLGVFFLGYIFTLYRAIRWLNLSPTKDAAWPLIFLNFLLLCNITESSLLSFGYFWLLYVSLSFSLAFEAKDLESKPSLKRSQYPPPISAAKAVP